MVRRAKSSRGKTGEGCILYRQTGSNTLGQFKSYHFAPTLLDQNINCVQRFDPFASAEIFHLTYSLTLCPPLVVDYCNFLSLLNEC